MQSLYIYNWNNFDTESIKEPIQMPKKTRIGNARINCLHYLNFAKVHHLRLAYHYWDESESYRLPEDIQTSYAIAQEATSLQELELSFDFKKASAGQASEIFSSIEAPRECEFQTTARIYFVGRMQKLSEIL